MSCGRYRRFPCDEPGERRLKAPGPETQLLAGPQHVDELLLGHARPWRSGVALQFPFLDERLHQRVGDGAIVCLFMGVKHLKTPCFT